LICLSIACASPLVSAEALARADVGEANAYPAAACARDRSSFLAACTGVPAEGSDWPAAFCNKFGRSRSVNPPSSPSIAAPRNPPDKTAFKWSLKIIESGRISRRGPAMKPTPMRVALLIKFILDCWHGRSANSRRRIATESIAPVAPKIAARANVCNSTVIAKKAVLPRATHKNQHTTQFTKYLTVLSFVTRSTTNASVCFASSLPP